MFILEVKEIDMSIYIVKNEQNEEISAYTSLQRAKFVADQLQSEFLHRYIVEELIYANSLESILV